MKNDKVVTIGTGKTELDAAGRMGIKVPSPSIDLKLFDISINSKKLMEEDVEMAMNVNCKEYMTEEDVIEFDQLVAEAAGLVIKGIRKKLVNHYNKAK